MSAATMQVSLLDRARAAAEEAAARYEDERAVRQADEMRRAITAAVGIARQTLGIDISPESVRAEVPDGFDFGREASRFELDGLSFWVWRDREYRHHLDLERTCQAEGCVHPDVPVLQEIQQLTDVVADGPFLHRFLCRYPLDESGEPIIPDSEQPARPIPRAVAMQDDVDEIERAADRLAQACRAEMELEDERPIVKADAVRRIMQRDGIAATPAEKIVESDEAFSAHRQKQYAAVVATIHARGQFESAKRRGDLAIALIDLELLRGGAIR